MKRAALIAAVLAALAVGTFYLAPALRSLPEAVAAIPVEPTLVPETVALRTNQDAVEVFRRAFWRDPGADDRILHAERREWVSEKDGVRRWQWFLAVEPGPEFAGWLREQNPFGLRQVTEASVRSSGVVNPEWFPAAATLPDSNLRQTADGGMTVLTKDGVIYATDTGHGFAVAARPEPANPPAVLPSAEHQPRRSHSAGTASN